MPESNVDRPDPTADVAGMPPETGEPDDPPETTDLAPAAAEAAKPVLECPKCEGKHFRVNFLGHHTCTQCGLVSHEEDLRGVRLGVLRALYASR